METEQKLKRTPRLVKPKKQEGQYETKDYTRRAVKNYEERMRHDFPEKYEKLLQHQRDRYYERKKLKEEQMKMQTNQEIAVV